MMKQIITLSETHLMVYIGEHIDVTQASKMAMLREHVERLFPDLIDVIPSYTSLMIEFHPLKTDVSVLIGELERLLVSFDDFAVRQASQLIELPVFYDPQVAPDLDPLAKRCQLSRQQVIDIHSQQEYTVCAVGFAPGFAFLGAVDERIAAPRHAEPRLKVAKGSVGIADQQTAVYPAASPGGWQVIGNCPLDLFDVNHTPMTPFTVGDTVKFTPITRERFIELGGQL